MRYNIIILIKFHQTPQKHHGGRNWADFQKNWRFLLFFGKIPLILPVKRCDPLIIMAENNRQSVYLMIQ